MISNKQFRNKYFTKLDYINAGLPKVLKTGDIVEVDADNGTIKRVK